MKFKKGFKKLFKRNLIKSSEGSLSFFLAFVLISAILLFFFVVATPFLMTINTQFYAASEDILQEGLDLLPGINDVSIRNSISQAFTDAQNTTEDNVQTLSFFYQYSWIFILVITIMVIFVMARKTVETKTIT